MVAVTPPPSVQNDSSEGNTKTDSSEIPDQQFDTTGVAQIDNDSSGDAANDSSSTAGTDTTVVNGVTGLLVSAITPVLDTDVKIDYTLSSGTIEVNGVSKDLPGGAITAALLDGKFTNATTFAESQPTFADGKYLGVQVVGGYTAATGDIETTSRVGPRLLATQQADSAEAIVWGTPSALNAAKIAAHPDTYSAYQVREIARFVLKRTVDALSVEGSVDYSHSARAAMPPG